MLATNQFLSYNIFHLENDITMNTCWAKYLLLFVVVVLGTSSMLSACGKKGKLYHPDQQQNHSK